MNRRMVKMWLVLKCLVLIGMCAQGALAQNYPVQPIRLVVTSTSGSTPDIVGRLIAPGMIQALGQQVIVDDRPGAASNIGTEFVAKAPADGYTVLLAMPTNIRNISLYRNLSFDFARDFAAVTRLCSFPMTVVVNASLPAKSMSDLVKLAKAKPGAINYSSEGAGSGAFMATELFKMTADVNLMHVPYKGGTPALTAVVAGETSIYFAPLAVTLPFVQSGKLRLLAVTSPKRMPALPDTPAVAESGYAGYEYVSWFGLMVPAKTPKKTIATIHRAAIAALSRPDVIERLADLGISPVGDQPEEFAGYIKSEVEITRKLIEHTGITAE